MEKNNFLLEVYFKTTPGHTTGIIVGKSSTEGYVLDVDPHGKARLRLRSGGADVAKRSSAAAINDGTWHHVIAEVDRSVPQGIRLYVDGKLSNGAFEGTMPNGSLSNTGDLVVGGDPKSNAYLSGTIDFLRISRGTLADAKTTIEELYDWQFVNGPQHFDFEGTEIKDNKRDAGAFEGAPSGISVNRSSETVSKAAYNVVTTLKAAAEKGMHNGMITLSENDSVMEATKDFGSAEILFGSDAISVTDTLVVQENGTYEFAVTTDDAVSFTLTKGAETNSVVANTSANVFRISLVSHTTYVYTIEKQQSSKASECMLTWQKVDK